MSSTSATFHAETMIRRDSGLRRIVSTARAIWSIALPSGRPPTAPLPAVDVVEIAEAVALDGRLPARGRQERLAVDGQHAVAHAQFVVIAVGVVVPDMHAVLDQIADVGIAPAETRATRGSPLSRKTFLVVSNGNPSPRSKRIWWPKTLRVPVPVRSPRTTPSSQILRSRSRYCFIASQSFEFQLSGIVQHGTGRSVPRPSSTTRRPSAA